MEINIIGAEGQIDDVEAILPVISALEKEHKSTIQLFRADRIFGEEHLQTAAEMAIRSWDRNPRAKTLGMEILLYAAAERQISGAIDKLGISQELTSFAILTVGKAQPDIVLKTLDLKEADVLGPEGKDHSIFNITEEEMKAASIPDLVLEKIALSELNR